MARRRQSHDEELPFVALMDTMTNVVGVLIIVLVMIGISLASSVKKVLSELPPVTMEQLQELLKKIVDNTPTEDPKKVENELKKLEEQLKKNSEELKSLDLTVSSKAIKMMDLDDLSKQIEERKKIRDAKKTDVEKLLAEVDRLKALLDTTPVYVPPASTVVKLPNPRPMPEKAVLRRFLVANGRVLYLNDEEFMKMVVAEIDKNQKILIVTDRGKPLPKAKLDQKKISAHFQKQRIGTREIKLELVEIPHASRIYMKLTPLPEGGETVEQVKNPASVFQRAMRKFKTEPDSVVWFLVFKDSLDTYLAARDIADQSGVPAGWEIYGADFFQRAVMPFEVDFIPAPPAPPAPPGIVRIPVPKTTLD